MRGKSARDRRPLPGTDPNRVHEVIFTTGTTGEPKGVMDTPNTAFALMWPAVERLGFSDRDVILMPSTFGHQTGYLYGISATVLLGATGMWLDVWNAETGAELIDAERVIFTMGATPFLQDLAYTPAIDRHDVRALRLFVCGGAAIPRKLVADGRRRLGCAISAGWGMSENGLVTCNGLDDPEEKVFSTDGRSLPGAELTIADADGHPAPAGVEGDLLVRAPSQFIGYFKRPEFTAESYTAGGWFPTGDRGTLGRDGYLSIIGRSKGLIIRGGENLSAAEIENLLFAHPKVASVEPGPPPTLAELVAFLEARQTRPSTRRSSGRSRSIRGETLACYEGACWTTSAGCRTAGSRGSTTAGIAGRSTWKTGRVAAGRCGTTSRRSPARRSSSGALGATSSTTRTPRNSPGRCRAPNG